MISKEELHTFKKQLDSSQRPLFLFDDDADGTSSFVLLDKYLQGKAFGICVKGSPKVDVSYSVRIPEFRSDKVFILDKPLVSEDFIRAVKVPIIWLDHHPPQDVRGVQYFNPRIKNDKNYSPTSKWAYEAISDDTYLWIAMIGMVGDWYLEEKYKKEFRKRHPTLMEKNVQTPQEALFETKLGKIIKIINFNLLGRFKDTMRSVKAFTKIKEPEEILEGQTKASQRLLTEYDKVNTIYEMEKERISFSETDELIIHRYTAENYSFTSELSNEVLYENPNKTVIIARESKDRIIMSLRSKKKIDDALLSTLTLFEHAGGGGHENACGASVKLHDFNDFVRVFKSKISS